MRRREFITLLGGAAAAWPIITYAQQGERMRRVGTLLPFAADDPQARDRMQAFLQRLQELGWMVGRNVQIDYRWLGSDYANTGRAAAAELVALAPDVVLTTTGTLVSDLQNASRSVPIVFAGAADAVGTGRVESLARPGGNATGFDSSNFELSPKWLELLRQLAPQVKRVAVLRGEGSGAVGQLGALQAVAPSFGVELRPVEVSGAEQLERNIAAFAREPNGGLIGLNSVNAVNNRALIVRLAAQHRLPGVYGNRVIAEAGGLASYATSVSELYRQAAGYVDRILKGEKPADLPVQAPTKYELVLNLKTAKALGLTVPPSLLATADEVIE
jgi:putative tryptophan/tyrosine transport system substrate-binding protein